MIMKYLAMAVALLLAVPAVHADPVQDLQMTMANVSASISELDHDLSVPPPLADAIRQEGIEVLQLCADELEHGLSISPEQAASIRMQSEQALAAAMAHDWPTVDTLFCRIADELEHGL